MRPHDITAVTAAEMALAQQWREAHFTNLAGLPCAFNYDGQSVMPRLASWPMQRNQRSLDQHRTEHTLTAIDPTTQLMLRCIVVEYHDFPTLEWTLYLKNTGPRATPIIENLQAMDAEFGIGHDAITSLRHHTGSPYSAGDYQPFDTVLGQQHIRTTGGRPTNSDLPYFNLSLGADRGVIVVVGWAGQWVAHFDRIDDAVRVQAGQERTHFVLQSGEEVRSPLMVLQFWQGDAVRAQNIWRRWMWAHNLPRPAGKLPIPQMAGVSGNHYPGLMCNEADEMLFIDRYLDAGIALDYWWMDAGWYPCDGVGWQKTGTWQVDAQRFPNGIRAVTDHGHARNVKSILWFEPERVRSDTQLDHEHADWLLSLAGQENKLLDLGNATARDWITERVDQILVEQGIDLYRQDFNMDPLDYWRAHDAPDRQGITENNYVCGYLAFWDGLLQRHPSMLIDSCASGGRRNDLETLRRAVPLLRSDWLFEPVSQQCHTYGIASWMPYYGTGFIDIDTYGLRSVFSPHFTFGPDMRRGDLDLALLRRLTDEWRRMVTYLLGDFYPLTPYSLAKDVWMAWQFDRPDLDGGIVQAFRRADCVAATMTFVLRGLDPKATYRVTDFDLTIDTVITGAHLMRQGLSVTLAEPSSAAIVTYTRSE